MPPGPVATTLTLGLPALWAVVGGRGAQEQTFAELTDEVALDVVPTNHYAANSAWQVLSVLAMLEERPVWNDQQLNELLTNPQSFVPGTTMKFGGIADATLRQDVIEFLKTLR